MLIRRLLVAFALSTGAVSVVAADFAPFVGAWRSIDAGVSVAVTSNDVRMRTTVWNGRKATVIEERLIPGSLIKLPDGLTSVDQGRFAHDKRTFTSGQLAKELSEEVADARRNPQDARVDLRNERSMRQLVRRLPAGPLRALRLGDLDHCTDRTLIRAENTLILRIDCKYEYALHELSAYSVGLSRPGQ